MHFEAESNGVKYEVNVNEQRNMWKVSLKKNEDPWVHYDFTKQEYQHFEDTVSFIFKKKSYLIDVIGDGTKYTVYTRGSHRTIKIYNEETLLHESLKSGSSLSDDTNLSAGMPGKIVQIFVKPGDEVKKDQPLLIMEAMKMENEMRASSDVKIKSINIKPGESVESGALLISYE